MKTLVFLSEIDAKPQDGLYWGQALRCGSWDYPGAKGGGFSLDEAMFDEMVANFKKGVPNTEVELNDGHNPPQGWVKAIEKRGSGEDATLWAQFSITEPEIKAQVDNGTVKYLSAEIDVAWVDPEACRTSGDCAPKKVFEGLALTNRPYIKRQPPITLSETLKSEGVIALSADGEPIKRFAGDHSCACKHKKLTEENMTLEEARKENDELKVKLAAKEKVDAENLELKAQLAKTGDGKTSVELSDEFKAKLAESDKRVALAEKTALEAKQKVSLSEFKAKLDNLFRKGKITPAQAVRTLRLGELMIKGDIQVIHLKNPINVRTIKLDEGAAVSSGTETESVDKVDVLGQVLDLLQDNPDAIATATDVGLDENAMDAESGDDDKKIDDAAKKLQAESGKSGIKLSYAEAAAKAAENLGKAKNRSRGPQGGE